MVEDIERELKGMQVTEKMGSDDCRKSRQVSYGRKRKVEGLEVKERKGVSLA